MKYISTEIVKYSMEHTCSVRYTIAIILPHLLMRKLLTSIATFAAAASLVTVFNVNDDWNLRLVQRMDDGTLVNDVRDHQSVHSTTGVALLNQLAFERNMDHLRKFTTCYRDSSTCKSVSTRKK